VVQVRDRVGGQVTVGDGAAGVPGLPALGVVGGQAAASALTGQLVDEVLAASTILIGMPLYNFGPPSTFKAWFDRIVSERTSGKLGDK